MSLPVKYKKKSFLEFDVSLNIDSLLEEYKAIPDDVWLSSYWGQVHCAVGMLLLRGGTSGTEADFWSSEVEDHPHLQKMPTFASLLEEPFGRAQYAFIFRMRPNGVALRHRDRAPEWRSMYRIHIPLITNSDAFLISGDRSLHLSTGKAWTFNNQAEHGVVNGAEERVHFIMDVPFNPILRARVDEATYHEGEHVPEHLARIDAKETHGAASYPGDQAIAEFISSYRQQGLNNNEISERLNVEKVPTKQYFLDAPQTMGWTPQMVAEFEVN